MDLPFEIAMTEAKALLCKNGPLPHAMITPAVRAVCHSMLEDYPHPVWYEIGDLDYENDIQALETWLIELLRKNPPPKRLKAYSFGVFEGAVEETEGHILYLCGNTWYDPEDGDWAANPAYFPDGRYAPSKVLRVVSEMMANIRSDFASFATCSFVMAYSALVATYLCATIDRQLLLGRTKKRHIAIGYDDGDLITLGAITENGLILNTTI